MTPLEIEGKTIDEAIEKACIEFGVPRERLHIEIVCEGTSGFLGIGSKKAKIKAGLMSLDQVLDISVEQNKIQGKPEETLHEPKEIKSPPPSTKETADADPVAVKAKELLERILQRMNFSFPVTIEKAPDSIILNIQGDGDGRLIGKKGQTIDALQYLVNKAVNRFSETRKTIVVDAEAYRKRKSERSEESLIALANKLGNKVKKNKKPITIGHMSANERRIIHLALQNDAALITKSRGEGEHRKIVILPAKNTD
jgi:spoIIIJ-associated protein